MTPAFPHRDELRALLDALCEETITPEQVARLEELVLAHPEAEAFYVQRMSLHADLIRHFRALPEQAGEAEAAPLAEPAPQPRSRRWPRLVVATAGLAGLAAAVLVAVAIWPRDRSVAQKHPE